MFFVCFFFAFFVLFFVVVVMIIIFSVLFIHLLYPQVITTQLWWRCYCTSLVLRPVYHSVFDHLQYAKTKGEGRLVSIYVSHEWRQCLPRWVHADGGEEQPTKRMCYIRGNCVCSRLHSWDRHTVKRLQDGFFVKGPSPKLCVPNRHWRHLCYGCQVVSLRFCISRDSEKVFIKLLLYLLAYLLQNYQASYSKLTTTAAVW